MRQEYEVKKKVTCDVCRKDITKEKSNDYYLSGDHHHNYIYFRINQDGGDVCISCEAKILFFCIIRRWGISTKLYKLFSDKKDKIGMNNFINKIIFPKWTEGVVEWVHWSSIQKNYKEYRD